MYRTKHKGRVTDLSRWGREFELSVYVYGGDGHFYVDIKPRVRIHVEGEMEGTRRVEWGREKEETCGQRE